MSRLFKGFVLLCLSLTCTFAVEDEAQDSEFSDDHWNFQPTSKGLEDADTEQQCASIKPTTKDIVKRFYAILPFFDKDHSNTAFLHKFRATVYGMTQGDDMIDREASFYAAVLTPIIFLHQYRDTWCLLERFHRALRLFQKSHPSEKRRALKLLQNLRGVSHKNIMLDLPGPAEPSHIPPPVDHEEEEILDKRDVRYLRELIKNLG